jgi:hypothetical protein
MRRGDSAGQEVRIDDAPETPSVIVRDRRYLGRARSNGPCANRRGIFHNQEHSNRASTQRFRNEIEVLRGFFGDPELRAGYRHLSDTAAIHTLQLARAKRRLVEVDRSRLVSYRQRCGNGRSETFG